jgi:hypothetical protein
MESFDVNVADKSFGFFVFAVLSIERCCLPFRIDPDCEAAARNCQLNTAKAIKYLVIPNLFLDDDLLDV